MKIDLHRKIELATNIAIMVVAALLSVVLVKNYLITNSSSTTKSTTDEITTNNQNQLQVGTKLSISGIDWAQNDKTLLLAISTTCHFCSESSSFYQRLVNEAKNTHLIAVLPQSIEEGKQYLNRLNVHVDDVSQKALDSLGVDGTPTLILVDKNGVVTASWVGKLSVNKETEVLSKLQ